MRNKLAPIFCVMIGLLIGNAPLLAHHGGSEYDNQHQITRKGTVSKWFWANPHCYVYLDVKDAGGKTTSWGLELSDPALMKKFGWSSNTFHEGDEVTITFSPSKKGTPVGHVQKVVLADGKVLSGVVPHGEQAEQ